MRTSLMMFPVLALICMLAISEARYYKKINADYVTYVHEVDWGRGKRQSHPDQTIARLPQIPFADPVVNEALPSGGGEIIDDTVPTPLEYLTPPAPDSSGFQAAPRQQTVQLPVQQLPLQQLAPQLPLEQPPPQQPPPPSSTKWDLGFEAGEILVPPLPDDQASQYDTLKLFTLLPTSSLPQGDLLDSFGPEEQESAADTRTPFLDSYNPESQSLRQEEASRPSNAPVYTFVKTDPHGHFKWGVHIGQ